MAHEQLIAELSKAAEVSDTYAFSTEPDELTELLSRAREALASQEAEIARLRDALLRITQVDRQVYFNNRNPNATSYRGPHVEIAEEALRLSSAASGEPK